MNISRCNQCCAVLTSAIWKTSTTVPHRTSQPLWSPDIADTHADDRNDKGVRPARSNAGCSSWSPQPHHTLGRLYRSALLRGQHFACKAPPDVRTSILMRLNSSKQAQAPQDASPADIESAHIDETFIAKGTQAQPTSRMLPSE